MMRWPAGGARQEGAVIRRPAVAGRFYDDRPDRLAAQVDLQLAQARSALDRQPNGRRLAQAGARRVAALVVPHAGHIYSGPVAASAYAVLDPAAVKRVVLLGPAHYVPVPGIGLSTAEAWRTPLGDVVLDSETAGLLRGRFDDVFPADEGHAPEHSLEVQLPFLQRVLGTDGWVLLPLIVGADVPEELAEVIQTCAGLPETLVVVSTDLSHYLDHHTARSRDDRTISTILARRPEGIRSQDACGRYPLRGLLTAAPALGWELDLLDARTSGDTAGSRDRVVGYAALVAWSQPPAASGSGTANRTPGTAWEAAPKAESPQSSPVPDESTSQAERGSAASTALHPASDLGPESQVEPPPATAAEAESTGIGPAARAALLGLARDTIEEALVTGRRPRFDVEAWTAVVDEQAVSRPGAAFVTLRNSAGDLLGCIGTLRTRQPLAADVAEHAYDAAFRDPRFPPLTAERAQGMVIDISVLSEPRAFPADGYEDLLRRLEPGTGLVVTGGGHRATFLPAVWEQLPTPAAFLAALWRKAGLPPGAWPAGTRIEVYGSEEFAEESRAADQ